MQVDISYFTFNGASGNTRMILDSLPIWLAEHPGTHVISIIPLGSLAEMEVFRSIQQGSMRAFAQNILRSVS